MHGLGFTQSRLVDFTRLYFLDDSKTHELKFRTSSVHYEERKRLIKFQLSSFNNTHCSNGYQICLLRIGPSLENSWYQYVAFNCCQLFLHGKFWDALMCKKITFVPVLLSKWKSTKKIAFFFNSLKVRVEDFNFLTSSTSFCFHKGLGHIYYVTILIWPTTSTVLKIEPVNKPFLHPIFYFWLILTGY